jgi:hypothetical protein
MNKLVAAVSVLFLFSCAQTKNIGSDHLYSFNPNLEARWSSGENLNGEKGAGAKENNGAKGHPSDNIPAHSSKTLLDIQAQGIINRIWFTINDRSPQMLRSLRIDMYWDNESKPAVSVPVADFFGVAQGMTSFQNEFFASPEGRSFNCFIPMPFNKAAKITITNDSDKKLNNIFFDVDYSLIKNWSDEYLYFHAWWNRDTATTPGVDFTLLPGIKGKGRILGSNVAINANPRYKKSWWGEGEVKMYIDGDADFPTLVGTGTEDYIGTAWGLGIFINRYTGCLSANDSLDKWSFYRYHVPDPIFFHSDARVELQQIGGNMKSVVIQLQKENVPLIPITVDDMEKNGKQIMLYEKGKTTSLEQGDYPERWTNFYRSDDVSAATFFYFNKPVNELPALPSVSVRTARLK